MPPSPKILSSLPASRNGTPDTVIINRDWYTSNLLYSLEEIITGLDFNATGEYVATIGVDGVCLISDVNKNDYSFDMEFRSELFPGNLECLNIFSTLH